MSKYTLQKTKDLIYEFAKDFLNSENVSFPDENNRDTQDIDAMVLFQDKQIAIEHTSIDTLPNMRKMGAHFREGISSFETRWQGKLGYTVWLIFPYAKVNWLQLAETVSNWLENNIKNVPYGTKVVSLPKIDFTIQK